MEKNWGDTPSATLNKPFCSYLHMPGELKTLQSLITKNIRDLPTVGGCGGRGCLAGPPPFHLVSQNNDTSVNIASAYLVITIQVYL